MKLEADVRALIAELRATLAGSSEGRGEESSPSMLGSTLVEERPGRPSLEPTSYAARMAAAVAKQELRVAQRKRKQWQEDEAARADRRRGRTYGPPAEGEDVFRGLRNR